MIGHVLHETVMCFRLGFLKLWEMKILIFGLLFVAVGADFVALKASDAWPHRLGDWVEFVLRLSISACVALYLIESVVGKYTTFLVTNRFKIIAGVWAVVVFYGFPMIANVIAIRVAEYAGFDRLGYNDIDIPANALRLVIVSLGCSAVSFFPFQYLNTGKFSIRQCLSVGTTVFLTFVALWSVCNVVGMTGKYYVIETAAETMGSDHFGMSEHFYMRLFHSVLYVYATIQMLVALMLVAVACLRTIGVREFLPDQKLPVLLDNKS